LRRKPDAIKYTVAGREPQTQVVMNRPAWADAQEARCTQLVSRKRGKVVAGSHEQAGMGRRCSGT
jgi:hypothetical protein